MKKLFNLLTFIIVLICSKAYSNDGIKICLSDHIFKEFKSYGESLENAVKMAIDGKSKNIIYEKYYFDNNPLSVIDVYQKMVKANCNAIIGFSYLSDLLTISNSNKIDKRIPIISPFGTTFTKHLHESIHPIHPSQDVLIKKLIDFIKSKYPNIRNATVLTDIRRSEMIEYKNALKKALPAKEYRLQFIDTISDEINKNKFIKDNNQFFFVFTGTNLAAKFIESTEYQGTYFGAETFGSKSSPSLINLLDKKKVKNIFAIRNLEFDNKNHAREEFYKRYQEKFNISPTMLSLYGYDAAKIIIFMKSPEKKDYEGITGAQFKNGIVIKSNLYSITSPSEGYKLIESGKL